MYLARYLIACSTDAPGHCECCTTGILAAMLPVAKEAVRRDKLGQHNHIQEAPSIPHRKIKGCDDVFFAI